MSDAPTSLKEMTKRAFGSLPERLPELEQKLADFQAQLKGMWGQYVLIYYQAEVPTSHTLGEGWSHRTEALFRLGVLEGEELIWADLGNFPTITLPISRYMYHPTRMPVEGNIFDQFMDTSPPALGYYLSGIPSAIGDDVHHAVILELLIGDAQVTEWYMAHHLRMPDLEGAAAEALDKPKSLTQLTAMLGELHAKKDVLIREHVEALKKIDEAVADSRQKAAQWIERGKSTGDSLRDILILHMDRWSKDAEQKFRDFQDQLRGKKGEFFLIAFTGHQRTRYGGPGTDQGIMPLHLLRLGVLTGEELVYMEDMVGGITVPVPQYMQADVLLSPSSCDPQGVIKENIFNTTRRGDPPPLAAHILGFMRTFSPAPTLDEVVVGDEEVKAWLLKRPYGAEYYKAACLSLSKLVLEPMGPDDGPAVQSA